MTDNYSFQPIGEIHSPYKEKFGIPRQPGLARISSTIEIFHEFASPEAFRKLEDFSHIWVIFVFHQTSGKAWHPTVRPPRLGGNERVGVFASRSMFRPNPIGLSVVELKSISHENNTIQIEITGGDFLDKTPVLDIKPYLPYVDAVATADAGYAMHSPENLMTVTFTDEVTRQLDIYTQEAPEIKRELIEILQYDPRPAYKANKQSIQKEYAMRIYELDVRWRIENNTIRVFALQ